MYQEIEKEFAKRFEGIELDFLKEYNNAMNRVAHYKNDDVIKNAIKTILSEVLAEYESKKSKGIFKMLLKSIRKFLEI